MHQQNEMLEDSHLTAFRKHRHDVINGLQMVRAYIQLNRPERALAAMDDVSNWLASLSLWTTISADSYANLTWIAAICPRILLCATPNAMLLQNHQAASLARMLPEWDEAASILGVKCVRLRLENGHVQDILRIVVEAAQEMRSWWDTESRVYEHLHIAFDRSLDID